MYKLKGLIRKREYLNQLFDNELENNQYTNLYLAYVFGLCNKITCSILLSVYIQNIVYLQ